MSIDQMIAELVSHDSAGLERLESAVRDLREMQRLSGSGRVQRRTLSFEPIRIQGEPLSQTIIRDRGER